MPNFSDALREQVTQRAHGLCEYCQSRQVILITLDVDHSLPLPMGGTPTPDTLCLVCRHCNGFRQNHQSAMDPDSRTLVSLFNPRTDRWQDHFRWDTDGLHLIGLTPAGRATIALLRMNREAMLTLRRVWAENGWHPPSVVPV
jgi:hypothetical protein